MRLATLFSLILCLSCSLATRGQILKLAELNTTQITALDRAHTVVLLTNGIMEEHGPYLPSFTDGYWDEALTQGVARAIVARPGWTVLLFPTIPLGTNPANVIAKRWSFPGSFTIRQDTVRDIFMDLADSFGEQGFKFIFIIDSHGGPTNSIALDTASDYFHDTYHGEMVHLMGSMTIFECCKPMEEMLKPEQVTENGMSLHADALEQAQILFVRPDLVPATYKTAPTFAGAEFPDLIRVAAKPDWPGYLGAPSLATAALGGLYFRELSAAISALAAGILDGKVDPRSLPRYGDALMPMTEAVELPMIRHEEEVAARHRKWIAGRAVLVPATAPAKP